jgi:antitoxin component HigA of HigAB toxin-antitoxin module
MTKFVALLRAINVGGTEARHYPMDPPDPIEAIQFRMEPQGLTGKDLESIIGTRARVRRAGRRRELRASAVMAGLVLANHAFKTCLA